MAVDSNATLQKRALQVGLLQEDVARTEGLGWNTYGSLALASDGQPGNVADDAFLTSVLGKALPEGASVRAPCLKRLYLEARSACLVDIKRTVESGGEDAAPKIPEIEKMSRLEAFKMKYPGTRVEGLHEPSSSLIDEYIQMVRSGNIRYLDWSKMLSREEELAAKKKTVLKVNLVKWTAEPHGLVASATGEDLGETALHSDYLIRCALHRRAVAVHVSGLLDFLIHERASELYLKRRFEATPAGYRMVSWEQIQPADEHVWKRLAHETGQVAPNQANPSSRPTTSSTTSLLSLTSSCIFDHFQDNNPKVRTRVSRTPTMARRNQQLHLLHPPRLLHLKRGRETRLVLLTQSNANDSQECPKN